MGERLADARHTDDHLFGGRLRLRQPASGHRAGTDAVLLAAAAAIQPGERFVDVGAGVGTIGLALALREVSATGVLIERDPAAAALARQNIVGNSCEGRITLRALDLFDRIAWAETGLAGSADLVVTNPPFYDAAAVRLSPDPGRRGAHAAERTEGGVHQAWARRCCALLAGRGRLLMIHRPEALPSLLQAFAGRLGSLRLMPIHGKAERPAIRVLIGGIRGSRAALTVLPPLILHDAAGAFTPLAEALHRGENLPFWPATRRRRERPRFESSEVEGLAHGGDEPIASGKHEAAPRDSRP